MSHRLKYRLQVKLLFIMAIQKPPAVLAAGNGVTAAYSHIPMNGATGKRQLLLFQYALWQLQFIR
jgi:hypothetical protein